MAMRDLPIELLFRLLPSNPELAALRDGVLAGSISDPARRWGGSAAFATLDKRVVPADALDAIFEAAEAKTVAYVRALHESLRAAVAGLTADDHGEVLQQLVSLGEAARTEGAWGNCVDWFTIVLSLAEEWRDSDRAILAARRIGLAHLHLGNVAQARSAYERSLSEAEMTNSREGAVVAHIGLGHLLGVQGRWVDAESNYVRALDLCDEADTQLMGQIKSNLSMTCRERGDLDGAAAWLDRAKIHWDALSRDDRSVWYNSEGMLLLEAHRVASGATGRGPAQRRRPDQPGHRDDALRGQPARDALLHHRDGVVPRPGVEGRLAPDRLTPGEPARRGDLGDLVEQLHRGDAAAHDHQLFQPDPPARGGLLVAHPRPLRFQHASGA